MRCGLGCGVLWRLTQGSAEHRRARGLGSGSLDPRHGRQGCRARRDIGESPGPFTVFAPTNEAFAALPAGVLEHLLRPENKAELAKVLTYHVVAGAVTASQIHDREIFKTVEGQGVEARVFDGKVFLQDRIAEDPRDFAQVVTADVSASNGVVHVINKVLLPL
eukprot:m.187919 g.187919  ORF g.187919 m.187919 type:complete len:163 (-) comp15074_c0_seq1:92-580(-)